MDVAPGFPRRGEIWRTFVPGQVSDPHQPRPALIVSSDEQNELTDTVIAVPIYSKGVAGPRHVPISQGVGGICHDSVLLCEEVSSLDRALIVDGPYGRTVPDALLAEVVLGVRRAIGDIV